MQCSSVASSGSRTGAEGEDSEAAQGVRHRLDSRVEMVRRLSSTLHESDPEHSDGELEEVCRHAITAVTPFRGDAP